MTLPFDEALEQIAKDVQVGLYEYLHEDVKIWVACHWLPTFGCHEFRLQIKHHNESQTISFNYRITDGINITRDHLHMRLIPMFADMYKSYRFPKQLSKFEVMSL